ncbi:MAG: RdgB/HAM1 family non-canonical purine NTP pyrophosphatase [Planctomycetota bacterium]
MTEILLATGNAHKREEFRALLAPLGIRLLSPADVGGLPDVVEDGATFAENAAKKAISGALASGRWTLADDSGLAVDALDGAPGVRSARFAGEGATDADNNALLLERLTGRADRSARFVAALALARPAGDVVLQTSGEAVGRVLEAPRGDAGFGYDPLFLFEEEAHEPRGKTFAELSAPEKAAVSHRGRALRRLTLRLDAVLSKEAERRKEDV